MISYSSELRGDEPVTVIQLDYPPATSDPARVFRAMALLIDAFQQTDRDLASAVSVSIEPVILLERVEAGSIRAKLVTLLREVNDDSLLNLDWRPLVGQYLVRAKHSALRWLERNPQITARAQVLELQQELMRDVPAVEQNQLLLPAPIPPSQLLEDVRALADAMAELGPEDSVTYEAGGETTEVVAPRELTSEQIETLLTEDVAVQEGEMILLVKKADFLGNSKWEFRLDDRIIEAKVLDEAWLGRFHAGKVSLRPGDALRAQVRAEAHRGFEGNVVSTKYFVLLVRGVVHDDQMQQGDLLP